MKENHLELLITEKSTHRKKQIGAVKETQYIWVDKGAYLPLYATV